MDSALARGHEPSLGVQVAALLAVPVVVLPPQATGDSLALKGGGAWCRPADETIGFRVLASFWMGDGRDGFRPLGGIRLLGHVSARARTSVVPNGLAMSAEIR